MSGLKERGWELVQIKAFTSWINGYLTKRDMGLEDIRTDLSDGIRLICFLELLSGKKVKTKYDIHPASRIQKIQNLHIALQFLEKETDIKLQGIGAEDFADGNLKLILGFLWSLFKRFRIQTIKQDDKSSEEGLLLWCKKTTDGYRDVKVEHFKTSFRDGLAFLALCDKYIENKSLLDFDNFQKEKPIENLNTAFEFAEQHMGIPRLLDSQEVNEGNVDERSLILYISLYFHAFVAKQQQRGILDEKERIEQQKKGLEGTLEERARQAQQLQLDNDKLCEEIESLKSQLKNEQEARAELQEKDTYLEEKVEVLKQLCEQESEEKTELEKAKQLVEKQLEELKGQYNVLIDSHGGRGKLVQSLQSQLEEEKKRTTELSLNVATLEESVASLKGDIKEISEKLEKERQLRQQETEANERRNKAELDGIGVLKVNLSNHIEDLRLWQKLLELPGVGDLDFQSEIRPQIVSSLNGEDFNKQVQILSKKLEEEDGELMKLWKMKEAEIKSKKAKKDSKKQHNK